MHTELKLTMKSRNTIAPSKGPSQQHLISFAGHWKVEGENLGGPHRPSQKVTGEEIYEWMEGDFFLTNRWERNSDDGSFKGLGWIGYDKATSAYLSYSISNLGFLRIYEVEVSESQIKFLGEHERGIVKLNNEENTLSIFWEKLSENSIDSEVWEPLCSLSGRRMT